MFSEVFEEFEDDEKEFLTGGGRKKKSNKKSLKKVLSKSHKKSHEKSSQNKILIKTYLESEQKWIHYLW